MQQTTVRLKMQTDYPLFIGTLLLVVIGLWMVFDTSYPKSMRSELQHNDAFYFVRRQAAGAILGFGAMLACMHIGYWNLRRWAAFGMLTALILLVAVFVPHVGVHILGAARWLGPQSLQFQPSELAKVALIVYVAMRLSHEQCKIRELRVNGLLPVLFVIWLTCLLIEREPDLGTALVLFLSVLTQMFLAHVRKRHLVMILTVSVCAVLLFSFGFGHRKNRLLSYSNVTQTQQGAGYQLFQSQLAIGSGSWTGIGIGRGRAKYYLPQANSDFIFATYAEETGFAGSCVMLTLFGLVSWRGFRIAMNTKDRFGSLLAGGIAALISWQTLVNIAVATGAIPTTGVPLAFISNGHTSLIVLMASVGILLNISQHPIPPRGQLKAAVPVPTPVQRTDAMRRA